MDRLFSWYNSYVFPSDTVQTRSTRQDAEESRAAQMTQLMAELRRELHSTTPAPSSPTPNSDTPTLQASLHIPNIEPVTNTSEGCAQRLSTIAEEVEATGIQQDKQGLPAAIEGAEVAGSQGRRKGAAKKTGGASTRKSSRRK